MPFAIETETDIERLRQVARLLEADNRYLLGRISRLTAELAQAKGEDQNALALEIQRLQEQLDRRTRELYGPSSEKRPSQTPTEETTPAPKKQTGHGRHEQLALPVVEQVHELDEADRICPQCGRPLEKWEGQFEESEEIDVIERQYRIVKHQRQKYLCRCGACVETAFKPEQVIPKGRYSLAFAVDVAVSKYLDHLPLTRQARIMKRQGLEVEAAALWDQLWALYRHLKPTYDALQDYVLSAPVIGADETPWHLLGKKPAKKGWAWSITRPDAVFYQILDSRSADAAQTLLKDYAGIVLADGYSAYSALAKRSREGPAFTLAHCWAHVRRKFIECEPDYPQAREALDLIGKLYAVERGVRDEIGEREQRQEFKDAGEKQAERLKRLALHRQTESAPLVKELGRRLAEQRPLPQSGLGKAVQYATDLWPGLIRFLDDPRIPIDNNRTERELRPLAVGRKNHYGSKTERGMQAAAAFYSLIESAKLAGLNPAHYLAEAARRSIANPGTVTLPKDLLKSETAEN